MVEMIQPASLSQDTIATATPTSPGVVSASTAIADDSHTTGISSEQSFAQASPHVNKSAFAADVLAEATELRVTTPNGPSSSPQIAPIPIAFVHTGTHFAVSDSLIQEQEQDQVLRCPRETLSLGNSKNILKTSHMSWR